MRLRTVRRRFRLTCLPTKYVHEAYTRMRGVSDENAAVGGKDNDLWVQTVKYIFDKYEKELQEELTDFRRNSG